MCSFGRLFAWVIDCLFVRSVVREFHDLSAYFFVCSFVPSFIRWFVCVFVVSVCLFGCYCACLFLCACVCAFVRLLVCVFVRPFDRLVGRSVLW